MLRNSSNLFPFVSTIYTSIDFVIDVLCSLCNHKHSYHLLYSSTIEHISSSLSSTPHHDFTTTSFLTIFFSFPPSFPSFRATQIYSSTFCTILHYTTYIIAIINSTRVFASGMLKMFPRLCVPNVPGEMGGLNARKTIDERISSLRTLCLW